MNLLIVLVVALFKPICMQYSQCVNPQNLRGHCVPIRLCDFAVNIARQSAQNPEARAFLNRSQCGHDGYTTYVCCPSQTTQLQPQPAQYRPQPTQLRPQQTQYQQQTQSSQRNLIAVGLTKSLLPRPGVCGVDLEDRIFGGTKTSVTEFPWLALLKYSKPGSPTPVFSCGGTLINDRYVVTAAHCVSSQLLQRTRLVGIRLGEWNLLTNPDCDDSFVNERVCNNPHVDVGIEELIIHERYVPLSYNQHNDIALLRMSQKINFGEFIKPICLQSETTSLVGQSVWLAGFGKTETAYQSNFKLKVSLNVVENENCNQVFRKEGRRLNHTQICAGGKKNIDSCRGDSGGPMMRLITQLQPFWVLVGVVSYGSSPCGSENRPAVYTRVSSYLDWIESKIRL